MSGARMAEFIAVMDMLADLANNADSLSVDEAAAAHEGLGQLQSETRRTDKMIETVLKGQLEAGGARTVEGRTYSLDAHTKTRYDHAAIERRVLERSIRQGTNTETGEISATDAVLAAIRYMHALYVSDSTEPKQAPLKALGLHDIRDVARKERIGTKIVVTDFFGED